MHKGDTKEGGRGGDPQDCRTGRRRLEEAVEKAIATAEERHRVEKD